MYQNIEFRIVDQTFNLPLYGICIGLGLIIGILMLDRELQKEETHYGDIVFLSLTVAIILGFFLSYIFSTYYLHNNLKNIFAISFLPGLFFGTSIFAMIISIFNYDIFKSMNLVSAYIPLTHAFGRFGCFFAGCCFGKPTELKIGICFPIDALASARYGFPVTVHATQLYEMFFLLFLSKLIFISNFNHRVLTYVLGYGLFRFLIEYLRGDIRGDIFESFFLTPAQLMCLIMVVSITTVMVYRKTKYITNKS